MSRKKKWLIGIAAAAMLGISAAMLGISALVVAASILVRRIEPYVREQAIEYLHKQFDSDSELAPLRIHFPKTSPLRLLLTKGRGTLKLQAKVSQTMTGWKRWALKPVDPFFAKEGAGTFLHIKVTGTSMAPKFGLDHGKKDPSS